MDSQLNADASPPGRLPGLLPFLLLLFFGSGCAALVYEIVWFQLLQLVIGSSAVSLGVLVGTYMGGMCLGSLLLPRLVSARRHPLRVYALLELGIGLIGLLILFGLPQAARVYSAHVGSGLTGILLRGLFAALCLLPPTMLMGATLPAMARWIETTPKGVSWLGFFYGGNIAGAVFGCLLAGFYLLRVHDSAVATFVAAAINGAVALAAFGFSGLAERAPKAESTDNPVAAASAACLNPRSSRGNEAPSSPRSTLNAQPATLSSEPPHVGCYGGAGGPAWPVHVAIALSGLTAIGAEVIWTRLLSLLLGGTVYTFSIILAVFLFGLGLGSGIGSLLARKTPRPALALGGCQWLLTGAVAWTAYALSRSLPYWPINASLAPDPWLNFQLDLARCLWALLPAAILWGASFPLALAAVAARGQDPARLVGGVYASNTVGGILGGIGFSILFIPWLGTQQSQRLLIGLAAVAALLMFVPLLWPGRKNPSSPRNETEPFGVPPSGGPDRVNAELQTTNSSASPAHRFEGASSPQPSPPLHGGEGVVGSTSIALRGLAILAVITIVPFLFARGVAKVPGELIAYGRTLPTRLGEAQILYAGEGMNSSVAVSQIWSSNIRNFHVSGKVEASSDPQDMRLQRMLGHLPALIHPRPRSVLIVGCGAGVTAGSFTVHPGIEAITLCELEPLVPKIAAKYFPAENHNVLKDPRTRVIYDDARHYILTTTDKFDIITSDPIHPWVKGSATLYTREYFELVKKHLNPGGIITQWVPLYESNSGVVKSELATFFEAFPDGTIWGNDEQGKGYDLVLLGQAGATQINLDEIARRLAQPEYSAVAKSFSEVGFPTMFEIFSTYAGQARDLTPWLQDAQINRDRSLRLQYLAGLSLNLYLNESIYQDMLAYRKFPDKLFTGSNENRNAVKTGISAVQSKLNR